MAPLSLTRTLVVGSTLFALLPNSLCAGSSGVDPDRALKLLVQAFDRTSPKNVVAIMRMPGKESDKFQTVKVQIAKDGRQRMTILEPFEQAQVVILELGPLREIYDPDSHTLTISASQSTDLFVPSERLKLVRRNYHVTLTEGVHLAGRRIVRLDATSRFPGFGGASIYIDPASFFVMRVDAVSPAGARVVHFDTSQVEYPAALPASTFELAGVNIKLRTRENDPVPVRSLAEARRKAGFVPLSPHKLPFGFVVRKTYVRSDAAYTTIGFNISDGLAAATVFEFDWSHCPESVRAGIRSDRAKHPQDFFRSGEIVVGIVSDLDPKIRAKLLGAFRRNHTEVWKDAEESFIAPLQVWGPSGPGNAGAQEGRCL